MTDRLFRPPGPAVTPDEARARRNAHHAAQEALALDDTAPPAPTPCPSCSSTEHATCHDPQTLEV